MGMKCFLIKACCLLLLPQVRPSIADNCHNTTSHCRGNNGRLAHYPRFHIDIL